MADGAGGDFFFDDGAFAGFPPVVRAAHRKAKRFHICKTIVVDKVRKESFKSGTLIPYTLHVVDDRHWRWRPDTTFLVDAIALR